MSNRVQGPHRKTKKSKAAPQQQLDTKDEQVSSPVIKQESPPLPSPSDFPSASSSIPSDLSLPSFPLLLSQVHVVPTDQRPMVPWVPYYYHHPDFGIESFMIYYHPH
ncbi:unnamed protein product [Absidia cylindrospora]